jgi:ATPase subunit of ABC transporter with duplicated ATPase domains
MAGYRTTSHRELEIDEPGQTGQALFPRSRAHGALISANNISFAYPGSTKKVLDDVTLTIRPGAWAGLVGKNGEGKSTLVKLLIGTLRPQNGTVERHSRLRLGYFDQHSVEILSGPGGFFGVQIFCGTVEGEAFYCDRRASRAVFSWFVWPPGRTATNQMSALSLEDRRFALLLHW